MATFIRLTNAFNPAKQVLVNLDRVQSAERFPAVDNDYQGRAPERTVLWFRGYGDDREAESVVETLDEIERIANDVNR